MRLIIIGLLTAFAYAAYNVFIKMSSGYIHQIVGALIVQVVALLLGAIFLLVVKLNGNATTISAPGVKYAIFAGVFVGLAELLSFYFFSGGVAAARGIPIIIGGSVVFAALIAYVFLQENISIQEWLGIICVVLGIVLLTCKFE